MNDEIESLKRQIEKIYEIVKESRKKAKDQSELDSCLTLSFALIDIEDLIEQNKKEQ